jgi:uncharacterized protein (DUF305 family)
VTARPPTPAAARAPGRAATPAPIRALAVLAALAVPLAAAACSGGGDEAAAVGTTRAPNVIQGAAPGETGRVIGPEESLDVSLPPHTAADVAFVQGMVHHHAQALIMVDMVEGRSDREDLALLAERMGLSQEPEVELMEEWLAERGEDVPSWEAIRLETGLRLSGRDGGDHGTHGHEDLVAMPGMLTADQLDALAAARGEEFDRLWLEGMIRHHEGALGMVQRLYDAGGGGELVVGRLAAEIEGDQGIEISRMTQMLASA